MKLLKLEISLLFPVISPNFKIIVISTELKIADVKCTFPFIWRIDTLIDVTGWTFSLSESAHPGLPRAPGKQVDGPQGSCISLGHLLAVLCNCLDIVVFEIKQEVVFHGILVTIFQINQPTFPFFEKIPYVIKAELFKLVRYHGILQGMNTCFANAIYIIH